jgi:membrane protein implicated in regulation of membrane protease activity
LKTNKEELKQLLLWLGILIAINAALTILLPFYLSFPLSLVALILIVWHIIRNRRKTSQV